MGGRLHLPCLRTSGWFSAVNTLQYPAFKSHINMLKKKKQTSKILLLAGAMVQPLKCGPYKHEDPSSVPRTQEKKLGIAAHV